MQLRAGGYADGMLPPPPLLVPSVIGGPPWRLTTFPLRLHRIVSNGFSIVKPSIPPYIIWLYCELT